jgi:hypothetical protein
LTKEGYFEIAQLCPEFNQFLVFPKIEEPPDTTHAACQTNADIQVSRARLEIVSSSLKFSVKEEPVDDYEGQNEFTQDDIEITEVEEEESDEEDSEQEAKRAKIGSNSNCNTVSDSISVENTTMESEEMDNEFASIVPILCDPEEPSNVQKARKSDRERNKPKRFIPSKPEKRIRQYQPKEEDLVSNITSSNPVNFTSIIRIFNPLKSLSTSRHPCPPQ